MKRKTFFSLDCFPVALSIIFICLCRLCWCELICTSAARGSYRYWMTGWLAYSIFASDDTSHQTPSSTKATQNPLENRLNSILHCQPTVRNSCLDRSSNRVNRSRQVEPVSWTAAQQDSLWKSSLKCQSSTSHQTTAGADWLPDWSSHG